MLRIGDECAMISSMSVENQILEVMNESSTKNNRTCFTPKHFVNLASSDAVKKALERLVKSKKIRRVTRGIYDFPYESKLTGILSPDITKVVEAIASRDKIRTQPTGAQAANLLGLSEQVPVKVVYLTDGRSKKIIVGNVTIEFRATSIKHMNLAGSLLGLIVQAFKYIGEDKIDDSIINKIKKALIQNPNEELLAKLDSVPTWIAEILKNNVVKESNV